MALVAGRAMTIVEFEDLLDRLGDDLSQWPLPQQAAARELLSESEAARRLLQEAEALRRLMARPAAAPPGLRDAIFTQTIRQPAAADRPPAARIVSRSVPAWMVPSGRFVRLSLLSICFVVGFACGFLHNMQRLDPNEVDFHDFVASVLDVRYAKD